MIFFLSSTNNGMKELGGNIGGELMNKFILPFYELATLK